MIITRIIYLKGTTNMEEKRKFINTSDALLHARKGGETFGLTCGEFAIEMKPVITWGGSIERNHIDILKEKVIIYNNEADLYDILNNFHREKYNMYNNGYLQFTPENVMTIFNDLFFSS